MGETWDAVVIGAGSVGTPTALSLAEAGLKVAVFDGEASAGRGENRAAIGGIRAAHSEPAKIALGREGREIFADWRERTGDDIGWRRGGYLFTAFRESDERMLRDLVPLQHAAGLSVEWTGPERVAELVPGIRTDELRGGVHSPEDGSANPLGFAWSCRRHAEQHGARFHFREPVTAVLVEGGRIAGVRTAQRTVAARIVVNAAGAAARAVGRLAGVDVPVIPESHEGGITAPVARFLDPLVIDLRPVPGSRNFYFHQNAEGQVVFCLTPDPPVLGTDRHCTSDFLPAIARRLAAFLPRLAHLPVRRVWRGLYPMTPDGAPLVGFVREPEGWFVAAGLCGQGFMLGPAVGALAARTIAGAPTESDRRVLEALRPDRPFAGQERLR